MKNTSRFAINEDNRLVRNGAEGPVVLDGSFSIEEDNSLAYIIDNKRKITFKGRWSLDSNSDLRLLVSEADKAGVQDFLALRAEIISAESDKIAFEIKTSNKDNQAEFKIITLSGAWGSDDCNRIIFRVSKDNGPVDILTLESGWQLNNNQEIVYTYEKADLRTKERVIHSIVFRGYWEISSAQRLSYVFSKGGASRFDFRVQLQTPNVYPKEGVIKYRIGIGLREAAGDELRIISLYGAWKFGRNLGLTFDMEYSAGKFYANHFGAKVDLSKPDEISFSVSNVQGEPIGFNLVFTHRFLKELDAEAFLRLKRISEDYRAEGGINIPF